MTEPMSTEERVAAMEANLAGWEEWRVQAVSRFTAVEGLVATGATRLAAIEVNISPVLTRLEALEAGGAALQAKATALFNGLAAAMTAITDLDTRLSALGRVARPGRTVIRGQVEQLQADMAAVLAQLPPTDPEGGGPQ